jgi:hypothetical protein
MWAAGGAVDFDLTEHVSVGIHASANFLRFDYPLGSSDGGWAMVMAF